MRSVIGIASLGLLVLASLPGRAQDTEVANNARFGDWVVNCEAVSTQRTACRISQTQTIAESGQLLLQLVAYPLVEGGALFVAQVPMGVYLPGGAVYALADDDSAQREMIWQRCAGQICEAAIQMDAEEVAAVTGAEQILVGYQMNRGQEPIVLSVNTATYGEALDAIR